ncbi:MAG: hypothetical protein K9J37_17520 [Saprospiraceae bacterium]|nr:hypothetical protein [Saprospiraceae bacterium]MCF8251717.1 hypothetical protein [Saprospiraceae bacterium]MCF8281099.1 hypothetical protein [Bacteroidales bacterium]MCF8311771.1 hypothetical protein [Saprospiraceae bacterium]MCF8441779.1 hypothetical protein [Saprospiraceae bacterium]
MKPETANLLKIKALLTEINELDKLIAMHQRAADKLMAKQYEARKRKFFDELVTLMLSVYPTSEMPPAFYIEKLMQRFYPKALEKPITPNALETALNPLFA